MIKIKTYKIRPNGLRGTSIGLPKVWIDDLQLQPGDVIDFYRDEKDWLILIPNRHKSESGGNGNDKDST